VRYPDSVFHYPPSTRPVNSIFIYFLVSLEKKAIDSKKIMIIVVVFILKKERKKKPTTKKIYVYFLNEYRDHGRVTERFRHPRVPGYPRKSLLGIPSR